MTELKPCPFCGGDVFGRPDENQKVKYVHCITCGTEGPAAHTMEDAADKWNTRQSPWISVGDRLPEANTDVFVMVKKRGARIAYQDQDGWFDAYDHRCYGLHGDIVWGTTVTHWMPIPPTQEKGDE
jgi:Lar family restriction alleviation protein